jgi:DNA-damage-inducible protein J
MQTLSQEEMNEALEKGYEDMKADRTREASKVFADIRKNYE